MILKKRQKLSEPSKLDQGLYSLRLGRYISILPPLVTAENVEKRMREKDYYNNNGAVEDVEIAGPFKHLNLICKT